MIDMRSIKMFSLPGGSYNNKTITKRVEISLQAHVEMTVMRIETKVHGVLPGDGSLGSVVTRTQGTGVVGQGLKMTNVLTKPLSCNQHKDTTN